MDEQAKKFLSEHEGQLEPTSKTLPLPVMKSRLVVQGSTIQNSIDHHIRLHFFGPKLEARLLSKTNQSPLSLQTTNWLAIERGYKKQQLQDKSAIFQLIHKKWYTHMDIARWDCDKNPICRSAHATRSHKKAVAKLKDGLHKAHTAPIIQRAILQCIDQQREGYENLTFTDLVVDDETKLLAKKVFRKQEQLGHKAFLQGYISRDWS